MIKGITVELEIEQVTSTDGFGAEITTSSFVEVPNVLVGQPTSTDITTSKEMYGRTAVYQLAIPKGDTHDWENKQIKFLGKTWKSFGIPIKGIDSLVPTDWNLKVSVERFDG